MDQSRGNTQLTVELMKRGAIMLKDPCPVCNGVQVRFKGKTYCTSHDNLENALSVRDVSYSDVSDSLKNLVLIKVRDSMLSLENEKDLQKQDQLVSLISKYVDLLKRVSEEPQRT